jgi:hypothetical protein
MDKTQRRIEIFKYLEQRGKAWSFEVMSHLENLLGKGPLESKFKQAVYRDLKALVESNQLGVNLYTPSGDPIEVEEEEKHSNVRTEYYCLSEQSKIRGQDSLRPFEADLWAPPLIRDSLSISESYNSIPRGHYVLSMELAHGTYRHLWFSKEDRPLTIHLGRINDSIGSLVETLDGQKQQREVFIFFKTHSVSRFSKHAQGHASVDFLAEENAIQVCDHNSTKGTSYGLMPERTFDNNFFDPKQTSLSHSTSSEMTALQGQKDLRMPCSLSLGSQVLLLSSKSA